jgi:cyclopropane fatty-acyl-phospholipid synthase-like methyltransferase
VSNKLTNINYIDVEYDNKKRPETNYPEKLAKYIVDTFNLSAGNDLLEVGCGRSELLREFNKLGINTYGIDSDIAAKHYAETSGAKFDLIEITKSNMKLPFNGMKFDIIFSKSFIEHLEDPISYFNFSKSILKINGKFINLTPDWESNYKIFYDDVTHIKPFSKVTIFQSLELANFKEIEVFRFRQLPITWNSKFFRVLSVISGLFAHHRVKNKWFRWSRELMIASVGINK